MSNKNEPDIFEQMSIFQIMNLLDDPENTFSSEDISKIIDKHQPVWVWDDHSQWGKYEEDDTLRDVWVKRFEDAAEAIEIRDPSNTRGLLPAFAQRMLHYSQK